MNGWYSRCYVVFLMTLALLVSAAGVGLAARVELESSATGSVIVAGSETPTRFLAKFDLPEYLGEAEIELAVVEFRAVVECDASVGGLTLNAFFVTEDWEAGLVDWTGFDGGGAEPFDRGLHAMWGVASGDSSLVRLDVTEMVTIWADDVAANRGFVLAPSAGEEGSMLPEFAGGLRSGVATLTIWYTPRAMDIEHGDGDR